MNKQKFIKIEDIEIYNGLLIDKERETEAIKELEKSLENPDKIVLCRFSFADEDGQTFMKGMGYASNIEFNDKEEQVEILKFFLNITRRNLALINNKIKEFEISLEVENE